MRFRDCKSLDTIIVYCPMSPPSLVKRTSKTFLHCNKHEKIFTIPFPALEYWSGREGTSDSKLYKTPIYRSLFYPLRSQSVDTIRYIIFLVWPINSSNPAVFNRRIVEKSSKIYTTIIKIRTFWINTWIYISQLDF